MPEVNVGYNFHSTVPVIATFTPRRASIARRQGGAAPSCSITKTASLTLLENRIHVRLASNVYFHRGRLEIRVLLDCLRWNLFTLLKSKEYRQPASYGLTLDKISEPIIYEVNLYNRFNPLKS